MLRKGEKYTTTGYAKENGIASGCSDVVNKLIIACGKCCKHYASDLLYDLNDFENNLKSKTNFVQMLGYRENGVDGESMINQRGIDSKEYKCIYEITGKYDAKTDMTDITLKRIR